MTPVRRVGQRGCQVLGIPETKLFDLAGRGQPAVAAVKDIEHAIFADEA